MDQTTAPASIEDTPRTSATAIAGTAIVVLILSYCVNAMDRTLFPLMLTDVRREYGFTLPQAGLMSTFFTLGMTLAGIPTGFLMSRYQRKTVIQVGIFIYSVATIVTVVAVGFADMLLYRAITGIGEAMQLTALLAVSTARDLRASSNCAAATAVHRSCSTIRPNIATWATAKLQHNVAIIFGHLD